MSFNMEIWTHPNRWTFFSSLAPVNEPTNSRFVESSMCNCLEIWQNQHIWWWMVVAHSLPHATFASSKFKLTEYQNKWVWHFHVSSILRNKTSLFSPSSFSVRFVFALSLSLSSVSYSMHKLAGDMVDAISLLSEKYSNIRTSGLGGLRRWNTS